MAALNEMNFSFNPEQQDQNGYNNYDIINDSITADDHTNDSPYSDKDMPQQEYLQEYEFDYTPNIVRWIKSNYMQHMKGAQDTVLISGSNFCNEYFLQCINYGKSKSQNSQTIEIIPDHKIQLKSEIIDIQFADDQTAIIATRNGEIQLIKLHENDQFDNIENDSKMIELNDNNYNISNNFKWKLNPINHKKIICKNKNNMPASLTSLAVNTIRGNILTSSESGYIYKIIDIDQCNSINICQSFECSSSAINCIQFANSDEIVSVSMSGQLMLWDLRNNNNKICYSDSISHKYGSLISLSVHPHRNHIYATGTEYGNVVIWDIRSNNNNNKNIFNGHCKNTLVNDINFLTNNSNTLNGLVTCGNDGITQIFQSQNDEWKDLTQSEWNTNITEIQEEKYPITSCDWHERLSVIATTSMAQKLSFFPI